MAINKPHIDELLQKTPSAYTLVVATAKRTRELVEGKQPLIDPKDRKPLAIAIEEVNRGLITAHRRLEADE